MLATPRSHSAGILTTLLLALVAAPAPGLAAEEGPAPAVERRGPPEEPGPPDDVGLERGVARRLAHLDERLGLGTFPNGSPLWPARMAAAIDYLAGSSGDDAELPGNGLLRRLAADLRRLGVDRELGGLPEEPGRPPRPPGKERAERLQRVLETVRLLHEKLDRGEAGRIPQNRLAERAAPANDQCASAQAIGTGTFTGSTAEASNDGTASCGSSGSAPDVWYVFTAPAAGAYTFDTFGSAYDTVLSLRTGCAGGSEIACNDDADGTLQSKLARTMAAGESVWIRVSGFGGSRGAYTLNVSQSAGISGTVTRRDTGDPLSSAQVVVYGSSGWYLTETTTSSDGSYAVALPPGTYFLRASRSGFIGELYDGIACPFYSFCWPEDGTSVTVGAGITGGIDFDLAPAASLSGTVTDTVTTGPLAGYVYLFGATGSYLSSYYTGSAGTYEMTALPSGKYYLRAEVWGYRSELYDDVPCGGSCSPTSGTPLEVAEGATLTGIDFALDRNPSIEGIVTEEGSGDPVAGQFVDLYTSAGSWFDWAWTSSDGTYRFEDVAPGTYFARTDTDYHQDELYDDLPCEPSCTVTTGTSIEAVLGSKTTGIDFVLVPYGKVAGTVTEAGTGAPVAFVSLQVHGADGQSVRSVQTASDGTYVAKGLPTGSYYLRTNSGTHANEVYDDVACDPSCNVSTGTAVATVDGSTTSGIDFVLRRRGSIAGRVTEAISGLPLAGTAIFAYTSSASYARSTYTDSDGTYVLEGLASGSYFVHTGAYQHQNEVYDDLACPWNCPITSGTPVAVQVETTTSGIDFALDRFGFIEGRVTASDTGQALDMEVYALAPNGDVIGTAWTWNGEFRIEELPAATYYVKTNSSWYSSEYQDELFDAVPCEPSCDLSLGTPLPVALNGGVAGVNLVLARCPVNSYDDLLSTYIVSSYLAEACERVSAVGVTVTTGADVTFKAGRRIVLGDGFKVEQGASFRAVIEPAWADD